MTGNCDGAEELGLVGEPKGVVCRNCADTDPVLWTVIFQKFSTISTLEGACYALLGWHCWGVGDGEHWGMCDLKRALHNLNITHLLPLHKLRNTALDDPLRSLGIWGHLHLLLFN